MKTTFALMFVMLAATACSTPSPRVDAQFGSAVRQNIAAQTINPNAGKNADQVAGVDGTAGVSAMERYHDSFKAPPPTFNVINIGGGIAGGK